MDVSSSSDSSQKSVHTVTYGDSCVCVCVCVCAQECPPNSEDFREMQCAAFNDRPLVAGNSFRWTTFHGGEWEFTVQLEIRGFHNCGIDTHAIFLQAFLALQSEFLPFYWKHWSLVSRLRPHKQISWTPLPGACRWMLRWCWSWHRQHTDAGQQRQRWEILQL